MLWVPAVKVEVFRIAVPPLSATVASVVVPSLNVTRSPFGIAPKVELTVEVNVTVCPNLEGFRLEATVVLLGYLLTTCVSTGEGLPVLFASPTYVAVIERFPDVLNEVL